MNGDGLADVIVGARRADPAGHNNAGESYVVFSPGNFEEPQEFPAAGPANRVDTGDLDGDGDVDVIVVIPGEDPKIPGRAQVFRNLDDGSGQWPGLLPLAPVTVGLQPSAVALGLLNNDSHLDAAVTNAGDNTITLLFNDGTANGTFVDPPVVIPSGDHPSAIATADFTEDGFVDLAVTNEGDDDISIFENDGTGGFMLSGDPLPSGGHGPLAIDPSDVDGDRDRCSTTSARCRET